MTTAVGDRDAIDRFLEMMAAQAGAAANTLAAYRRDLTLASADLDGGLSRADAAALGRLADGWRDLSGATVARKAPALRRFCGYLAEEGDRADDPSPALPRPATRRPLPRTLGHGDVDRLFAALGARLARDPVNPTDLRLAALVEGGQGSPDDRQLRAVAVASRICDDDPEHEGDMVVLHTATAFEEAFLYDEGRRGEGRMDPRVLTPRPHLRPMMLALPAITMATLVRDPRGLPVLGIRPFADKSFDPVSDADLELVRPAANGS